MLNDVTGKPIHAWDSRDHQFRTTYDQLRRPVETFLREGAGPERSSGAPSTAKASPNPEVNNQRGKVVQALRPGRRCHDRSLRFQGQSAYEAADSLRRITRPRSTG